MPRPVGEGGGTQRDDWQERFLATYAQSGNITLAAKSSGINRITYYRELARDEEFVKLAEAAKQEAVDIAEAELRRRATVGTPTVKTVRKMDAAGVIIEETVTETTYISTAALIAYLRANHPAYREGLRVEHTGGDGGPVQIQVERERTPERLEALLAVALELGWRPDFELPAVNGNARILEPGEEAEPEQ